MANSVMEPRLRVSKSTSLTLSPTWQRLIFDGTDSLNINTFGKDMGTGNPQVYYDTTVPTAPIFRFYNPYDTNYIATLFLSITVNAITTRTLFRYRCVVPNGVSPGVPLYYPFTSAGGFVDVMEVTVLANGASNTMVNVPLYLNDTIRANGMYIEVGLSNALITLGVATLNSCAFLIQGSKQ